LPFSALLIEIVVISFLRSMSNRSDISNLHIFLLF
jgi:hypothetical protein